MSLTISKVKQSGVGAVNRPITSKLNDFVSVKDFGAVGDGITNDTAAIQAAINTNATVYLPPGTYGISSLDFRGKVSPLIGAGFSLTTLKVLSAVTTAINLEETIDTNPNPYHFSDFTLLCNSLATYGFKIKYRHAGIKENLFVFGSTGTGIWESDTYLTRNTNIRTAGHVNGWHLVGSNHASTHVGCTYDGNSGAQLLVETNGVAADGNSALTFVGCDFESGVGAVAYGIDIACTDASFTGCYIGENLSAACLLARAGIVSVNGGSLFFGNTVNAVGVAPVGGRVLVSGASINGQTNGSIPFLVGGPGGGKVQFQNCSFNGLVSGSPIIPLDMLDYGPQGTVYAPRLGKSWTGQGNNVTFSSVVTGNSQKFTVLTAPGPTPLLGAKALLTGNAQWRDGETLYLVIVYESTKLINVSLSGGAFGGAPLKSIQASLPATSGAAVTGIGLQTLADNAAYTLLEVIQQSSAVGDFLTIYEVFLADSRMLNKGSSQFGNLYKC